MFFAHLKRLRRRLGFQLAWWYSVLFTISCCLLFSVIFLLLASSLRKNDHKFIRSELGEYSSQYNSAGFESAIEEIDRHKKVEAYHPIIIRISDSKNHTLYLSTPELWRGFNLKSLEEISVRNFDDLIRLPKRNDEDYLEVGSIALEDGNILQIGLSSGERNHILEKLGNAFLIGMILVVLLALFGGSFLSFRWLRPIKHLSSVIRTVSETGQTNARVPLGDSGDELDELGSLFNQMLDRLEKLIQAMRDTLDNAAHDLRTPLTRLRGIAEDALQTKDKHSVCQEALAGCLEESEHLAIMLKTLMDISEAENGALRLNMENIDVSELIESVADVYQHVADEKNVSLRVSHGPNVQIEADRVRIKQVFGNLLDNAIKYTHEGGIVEVSAERSNDSVIVSFSDNGIGIPPHEIDKIWERLFRGDASRSEAGLGLGLSLVKAVMTSHRGVVTVKSEPGQGSVFTVQFF